MQRDLSLQLLIFLIISHISSTLALPAANPAVTNVIVVETEIVFIQISAGKTSTSTSSAHHRGNAAPLRLESDRRLTKTASINNADKTSSPVFTAMMSSNSATGTDSKSIKTPGTGESIVVVRPPVIEVKETSPTASPVNNPTPETQPAPPLDTKSSGNQSPHTAGTVSAIASGGTTCFSGLTGGVATTFPEAVVKSYNLVRQLHGTPELCWNQSLADLALSQAKLCNQLEAKRYPPQFVNSLLGMVYSDSLRINDFLLDQTYNLTSDLANTSPEEYSMGVTGMVWSTTTSVGCSYVTCDVAFNGVEKPPPQAANFLVCNEWPPGNNWGVSESISKYVRPLVNSGSPPGFDSSTNFDNAAILASAPQYCQSGSKNDWACPKK